MALGLTTTASCEECDWQASVDGDNYAEVEGQTLSILRDHARRRHGKDEA